jgi:PAS domain S-box-containing protein
MEKDLQILIVEDTPADAELTLRELQKANINFSHRLVETKEDYIRELDEFKPDIILSDYFLPKFTGMEALKIKQVRSPNTPLIILTGAINEETAVDCMKAGAIDYVLKDNIIRLAPAFKRALEIKRVRAEREIAYQALRESEERYRSVLAAMEEGVIMQDSDGVILACNASAEEILGMTEEQMVGNRLIYPELKTIREDGTVFPVNEFPAEVTLRTGKPMLNVIVGIYKKDNTLSWISINSQPLIEEGESEPYAVVSSFSDITRTKKTEEDLKKTNERLARSNKLLEINERELTQANLKLSESERQLREMNANKDKFFSIISRDLKNPLYALLGFSDFLVKYQKELVEEEIVSYSTDINTLAKQLFGLVENLHQWSSINTDKLECKPEKVDLSTSAGKVIKLLRRNALIKNIDLYDEIPEETFVLGDVKMINSIMQNLVSNALKFTNQGGYVRVDSKDLGSKIEVSITDNGIGMSQEKIQSLFKIDTNPSTPGTAHERGSGLGLIICKELIEKNGGTITVKSKADEGTEVTFTLSKYLLD